MQRVPYQHSREKSSAARKHCKSNNIILMPEFHVLSKPPRTTSGASPRTEGWGGRWRVLRAEAQHYSQPARGSQLEDETSLHVWVTADGGSSLVQQSNTSCWAVRTTSEHPPSSNSRQHGARLGRADSGCSARTRHRCDKIQHEERLKVDRQTKLLWDHTLNLEQRQHFSDKYDAHLPCQVRLYSANPQQSEHQCWHLMVPTSISLPFHMV